MKDSVAAAFPWISAGFEGRVPYMYLDILGLVTTGVGNLIDPIEHAMGLPWTHRDGRLANAMDVRLEWGAIKHHPNLAKWGHRPAADLTDLRLSESAIDALVTSKALEFETVLRRRFPAWDTWPADAQLAVLLMAWALGPSFHFVNLATALGRPDFAIAALSCEMDATHNAGLKPRNAAVKLCFTNASSVVRYGIDPEILHYPRAVTLAPSEAAPTQPELPDDDVPDTQPSGELVGPQGSAVGIAEWAASEMDRLRREG